MGRPAGVVGRTQLKQDDLVRIQTLSRDARMGPSEIRRVTGYSIHQIKYALKKKTPTVGKRSGRPRKGEESPGKKGAEGGEGREAAGDEGQAHAEGLVQSENDSLGWVQSGSQLKGRGSAGMDVHVQGDHVGQVDLALPAATGARTTTTTTTTTRTTATPRPAQ